MANDLLAAAQALPPEITGAPGTAPIGALSPEEQAAALELARRQEEATAFNVLAARQNPQDYQLAHTHAPMDGAAATPIVAQPPIAPVAAPFTPPSAPVAPPAPTPKAGSGKGNRAQPDNLEQEIVNAGKAGAAAIDKSQDAKADASDNVGRAYDDLRVQQQMDAQELRDKQEATRAHNEELDRQDAAALKKARDYTIPDFWKGHEGALVGSTIAIAMGGIAQGVLGGPNGADQIIQRHVDQYFQKEKTKVDNLYRYAEQQGRLDDRTRLRYAQELLDLKDQHAAVQQSILSHIKSVEAQNTGNIARAETDALKAKLTEDIIKQRGESKLQRAHVIALQAQANASNANAEESRAKAAAARAEGTGGAGSIKEQKLQLAVTSHLDQVLKGDKQFQHLDAERQELEQTLADLDSGNPIRYGAALDKYTKSATGLGARPSSVHLFEQRTGGTLDKVRAAISMAQDGNPLPPAQLDRFKTAVRGQMKENAGDRGRARKRYEGGLSSNPLYKSNPEIVRSVLDQKFGMDEAAPTGSSPSGGNTVVKMKDGTTQTFDASGRRIQ